MEGIIVALLRTQRCEITRINIAHLREELPLDVGCGGVLNHAIYKRDALLIEPVRLLGLTHLVDDFCLNSQIAWNEVKLIGNFGVRVNGAVYRRKRVGEVAVMLIRFGEKSTCVGNAAVVADLA